MFFFTQEEVNDPKCPQTNEYFSDNTGMCFISFQSSLNFTKTNKRTFMISKICRAERSCKASPPVERCVVVRWSTIGDVKWARVTATS